MNFNLFVVPLQAKIKSDEFLDRLQSCTRFMLCNGFESAPGCHTTEKDNWLTSSSVNAENGSLQ